MEGLKSLNEVKYSGSSSNASEMQRCRSESQLIWEALSFSITLGLGSVDVRGMSDGAPKESHNCGAEEKRLTVADNGIINA
ncbi:hypothetical protein MHYP_G00106640 [Metynnis hypsauchen]